MRRFKVNDTMTQLEIEANYLTEHIVNVIEKFADSDFELVVDPDNKPRFEVSITIQDYKMDFKADSLKEAIKYLYGKDEVDII